ncbi:MAG: hypothetical protein JW875_00290 [Spirochaetales bacterium]|nr:hypothetical protein [Spirochaetales bacterium]
MKRFLSLVCSVLISVALFAQETSPAPQSSGQALSDTYRSITLGMDIESVKEQLLSDGIFGYRGDRDVSLLPYKNRSLIETSGSSFIKRAFFQFYEEKLYIMIFMIDVDRMDYYSLYTTFVTKYGEPTSLDPAKALWKDERVIVTLERPLTVKYVDQAVFQSLIADDSTGKAASDILREEFLGDF